MDITNFTYYLERDDEQGNSVEYDLECEAEILAGDDQSRTYDKGYVTSAFVTDFRGEGVPCFEVGENVMDKLTDEEYKSICSASVDSYVDTRSHTWEDN